VPGHSLVFYETAVFSFHLHTNVVAMYGPRSLRTIVGASGILDSGGVLVLVDADVNRTFAAGVF
jgi:hypothetical protein